MKMTNTFFATNKMKIQVTENTCIYIKDKGLTSRMHIKIFPINMKKIESNRKWSKDITGDS